MSSQPMYEIELRAPLHPEIPKDAVLKRVCPEIIDTYYMMQPRLRVRQVMVEADGKSGRMGAVTMKTMLDNRSAGKVKEHETNVEDAEAMIVAFDEAYQERIFSICGSRKEYTLPLSEGLARRYVDRLPNITSVTLCVDRIDGWKVREWSEVEVITPTEDKMLKPAMNLLHDVCKEQLGIETRLTTETDYVEWQLRDRMLGYIDRCRREGRPATYNGLYKNFNHGKAAKYIDEVCKQLTGRLINANEDELSLRMPLEEARESGELWQYKAPKCCGERQAIAANVA